MRKHRYRCTHIVTTDHGDGPAEGKVSLANLAVVPDGSHWQSRPAALSIRVREGTRPGSIWELTLEEIEPAPGSTDRTDV